MINLYIVHLQDIYWNWHWKQSAKREINKKGW